MVSLELDIDQLCLGRCLSRLQPMTRLPRLCLLLLLTLILPLQGLASSLLVEPPCPMSQQMPMLDDCCEKADMPLSGQLCADMAKCSSAGLPLAASQGFKAVLLPTAIPAVGLSIAAPLSRSALAPWRPPRA